MDDATHGADSAFPLPSGLPRPEDDGACDHLPGARLPAFDRGGRTFVERVPPVADDGVVARVCYPVFPPGANADEVLRWLRTRER